MSKLTILTCFYNPCEFENPRNNFELFRSQLPEDVDVLSLCVKFGNEQGLFTHERKATDANKLWLKERAINLLVPELTDDCDVVCWADADILFRDDEWPRKAIQAADRYAVFQLFDKVSMLDKRAAVDKCWQATTATRPDYDYRIERSSPGFAWGARREVIEAGGLFDLNMTGNADVLMFATWIGMQVYPSPYVGYSEEYLDAWYNWKTRQQKVVAGKVGYIRGDITHLYHGSFANRRYQERERMLSECKFNPVLDVCEDVNGLLKWTGRNPELEDYVKSYFSKRKEDL